MEVRAKVLRVMPVEAVQMEIREQMIRIPVVAAAEKEAMAATVAVLAHERKRAAEYLAAATEVHRRRAPELVFRVALPDEHPDVMPGGGPRP